MKLRSNLLQVSAGHFVVQRFRIAAFYAGHGPLGQGGFDAHDRLRLGGGRVRLVAKQLKHFLHMCDVLLAQFDGLCVVLRIVVAVGKPESALIGVGNHLVRIAEVLNRIKTEEHIVVGHGRGHVGDFRLGADFCNSLQPWLERFGSLGVDGFLVGTGSIVIADFLVDCTALRIGCRSGF